MEVKISNHERKHRSLRRFIVQAVHDKLEDMNSETNNNNEGDLSPSAQNKLPEDTSNNIGDYVHNQPAPVAFNSPCQNSAESETPNQTSQSTHTPTWREHIQKKDENRQLLHDQQQQQQQQRYASAVNFNPNTANTE